MVWPIIVWDLSLRINAIRRALHSSIYIHDTTNGLWNRLNIYLVLLGRSAGSNPGIVEELLAMLNEHSELVKTFREAVGCSLLIVRNWLFVLLGPVCLIRMCTALLWSLCWLRFVDDPSYVMATLPKIVTIFWAENYEGGPDGTKWNN
jgi:hypothetical protein